MKTKTKIVIAIIATSITGGLFIGAGQTSPGQGIHAPQVPVIAKYTAGKRSSDEANQTSAIKEVGPSVTAMGSSLVAKNPTAPNYRYHLLNSPADPSYAANWGQQKIQANRAWDMTTGSSSTVIAVIDSPFDLTHQDLAGRWHQNSGEVGTTAPGDRCWTGTPADKSTNNCDDDGNGYVDDWRGYDFVNNDNNVQAGLTNPSGAAVSHSTMVSGVIAATANNGLGGVGLDWQASIMPLQVFSDDGEGYTADVVAAMQYAVDNGAQIINLSLGTTSNDTLMHTAVQYANDHGVLVVAASGNCVGATDSFCSATDNPGRMLYPARFTETFAVGASTQTDSRANFSSYGPELDVVAPGVSIGPVPSFSSSNSTSYYEIASGTSFASPMVTGVAALIKSQNPNFSPSQIATALTDSAEKPPGMSTNYKTDQYGYGRINAHRATLMAKAYTEASLLGSRSISQRESPIGGIWRATSGSIGSDEWVLIGCRVSAGKQCSATVQNGSIYRFTPGISGKNAEIQYVYVQGSAVPPGTWTVAVHSDQLAAMVGTLTR